MKILVIIPAYNEADVISQTILGIQNARPDLEIVVVDDGSTDTTAQIAAGYGVQVLRTPGNIGKGDAINFGLKQIPKCDIVAFLDADLGECASQVQLLLDPVESGTADMTIAGFPPAKRKGGFGFVKRLARDGIFSRTGQVFNSPISGQRAMLWEVIAKIGPIEQGYGAEVALTIDALRCGFRVLEVPLEMTHRESGRNIQGFIHRGRQYIDIRRALRKRR